MKKQWNEEEHKREWVLEGWLEKTAYVVGVILSVVYASLFAIGFIIGLAG